MVRILRFGTVFGLCGLILWTSVGFASDPSVAIAVIGDYGCDCPAQGRVARQLLRWHTSHPFQIVLTTGDNIYGKNYPGIWRYLVIWHKRGGHPALFPERFDRYYAPLIQRGVRFHATLGNHDLETARGKYLIRDRARFGILGPQGYYKLSLGRVSDPDDPAGRPVVDVFVLNSNRLLRDPDLDQRNWLADQLDRSRAFWKIVVMHHPIRAPRGGHVVRPVLRRRLLSLFRSGGVDIVFAGHHHYYARMRPEADGIVHFVVGNGGAPLYVPGHGPDIACVARVHGFLYTVWTPRRMSFQAVTDRGTVIDAGEVLHTENGRAFAQARCAVSGDD